MHYKLLIHGTFYEIAITISIIIFIIIIITKNHRYIINNYHYYLSFLEFLIYTNKDIDFPDRMHNQTIQMNNYFIQK